MNFKREDEGVMIPALEPKRLEERSLTLPVNARIGAHQVVGDFHWWAMDIRQIVANGKKVAHPYAMRTSPARTVTSAAKGSTNSTMNASWSPSTSTTVPQLPLGTSSPSHV